MADGNNALTRPTGPQFFLHLSEGSYGLRDDLHLGATLPHPAEANAQNQNVLDPKPVPPTAGTQVSLARIVTRPIPSRFPRPSTSASAESSVSSRAAKKDPFGSSNSGSENGSNTHSGQVTGVLNPTCTFGEGNLALIPPPAKDTKDPARRKKPKNNVAKSGSSFISRTTIHDSLNKRLQEHKPEGLFGFANNGRSFMWLDLSVQNKQEPLTKILFTKSHPLCHHFNDFTKTSNHLDIVIGFSAGDILWYEPMTQKYTRLNKNGAINSSAVSDIRWLPGSENLFMAAHFDGSIVVYDKEKEDANFTAEEANGVPEAFIGDDKNTKWMQIKKSVQSKNQKTNPLSFWKASNHRINSIDFSPDGRLLAAVSEDGALRVYDYLKERLLGLFPSYYGGITCICWSPDSMYLVTGGQDDIVSIWSVEEQSLVARCLGHRSWITCVAFDPWRCDERTYRIGSVGDDCRLLLWDFSVGMLHRPRAASIRQSISSYTPMRRERTQSSAATTIREMSSTANDEEEKETEEPYEPDLSHPVLPRAQVPILPPVLTKQVDEHPLSWIGFEEDSIMIACKGGHVRTWDRPTEDATAASKTESTSATTGAVDFADPFRI